MKKASHENLKPHVSYIWTPAGRQSAKNAEEVNDWGSMRRGVVVNHMVN